MDFTASFVLPRLLCSNLGKCRVPHPLCFLTRPRPSVFVPVCLFLHRHRVIQGVIPHRYSHDHLRRHELAISSDVALPSPSDSPVTLRLIATYHPLFQ
jgi:hypothetical protein